MPKPGVALVVGADSRIGRALEARLAGLGWLVLGTSRRGSDGKFPLDLRVPHILPTLPQVPDVAFLCAAETSTAACKQRPDESLLVNVTAPSNLAAWLAGWKTHLIFLSTNAVFRGSAAKLDAAALPDGTSSYGRQKALAEKALSSITDRLSVIRFGKVIGSTTEPLSSWIETIEGDGNVEAFDDMPFAPISLDVAVDALVLAAYRRPTILQLTASGDMTYFEAARYLAVRLDRASSVRGISWRDRLPADTHVPQFTTLSTADWSRLSGETAPAPQAALDWLLANRRK